MRAQPQPYEVLILVCTNFRDDGRPCCAARGSEILRDNLKAEVKARGLQGRVRVSQSGCLDRCSFGPTIMVFPEGVWYSEVTVEDLPEILARHLPAAEIPRPLAEQSEQSSTPSEESRERIPSPSEAPSEEVPSSSPARPELG